MNLLNPYRNPNLERCRREMLRRRELDAVLNQGRSRLYGWERRVLEAVHPDVEATSLRHPAQRRIRRSLSECSEKATPLYRELVMELSRYDRLLLLEHAPTVLQRVAENGLYVRPLHTFRPRAHSPRRQISELLRHLFTSYHVPPFLDIAWVANFDGLLLPEEQQELFIRIGNGDSVRRMWFRLPIRITRRMAHLFLNGTPSGFTIARALRRAQVLSLGGSNQLVRAILASQLGQFFDVREREAFWESVILWLVHNRTWRIHDVPQIIDYLHAARFEYQQYQNCLIGRWAADVQRPNLCFRGRSVATLLRQAQRWRREILRLPVGHQAFADVTSWPGSGLAAWAETTREPDGTLTTHQFIEIRTVNQLLAEAEAMRHCISRYARSCINGHAAIFSYQSLFRGKLERVLTIELWPRGRMVMEIRGAYNRMPTIVEMARVARWASQRTLTISEFACD